MAPPTPAVVHDFGGPCPSIDAADERREMAERFPTPTGGETEGRSMDSGDGSGEANHGLEERYDSDWEIYQLAERKGDGWLHLHGCRERRDVEVIRESEIERQKRMA